MERGGGSVTALGRRRRGLGGADIGERLGIRRSGASYHVPEIIGKLGVRNRYEAAAWPDRPPWWATAIAPIAAMWRRAAGRVPGGAGGVALAEATSDAVA